MKLRSPTFGPKMIPEIVFRGYITGVRWEGIEVYVNCNSENYFASLNLPLALWSHFCWSSLASSFCFSVLNKSGSDRWGDGLVLSCPCLCWSFLRSTGQYWGIGQDGIESAIRGTELIKVNGATEIPQYCWFSKKVLYFISRNFYLIALGCSLGMGNCAYVCVCVCFFFSNLFACFCFLTVLRKGQKI